MNQMTMTIEIPEEYEQWLLDEAARRETSVEELVWEAIYIYHNRSKHPRKFRMEGIGYSGEPDLSQRVEEILAAEWPDYIDPIDHRSTQRSGPATPQSKRKLGDS